MANDLGSCGRRCGNNHHVDKLLTIRWFARLYGLWTWLKLLVTQNIYWRSARRRVRAVWLLLKRTARMA
mgnify:CR=1 FL=1